MRKINFATIGLTGAIAVIAAATVFAAPMRDFQESQSIKDSTEIAVSEEQSSQQEITGELQSPAKPELQLPDNRELPEEITDDQKMPEQKQEHLYIPKFKPDTKPDDEDRIPPEFENIENIDVLGRPEFPADAPDYGEEGPDFINDRPEWTDRPEMVGQQGEPGQPEMIGQQGEPGQQEMIGQPGEFGREGTSEGDENFGSEMPDFSGENFGGEMPDFGGESFGGEMPRK